MSATPEQVDRQMEAAYGPFVPGSIARAIRHENWKLGFKTCWQCIGRYRATFEYDEKGRTVHAPGRGVKFCSRDCWAMWQYEHPCEFCPPRREHRVYESETEMMADIRDEMETALAALRAHLATSGAGE